MKKLTRILLMASLAITFSSCSKQEGCTDPKATNYSSDAEEDCHCCRYESSLVFWYGLETQKFLENFGSTVLYFYVDDKLVGSQAANVYWTGQPSCGQASSITVDKDLGESKSKAFTYKIMDQDNDVIWDGVFNFEANTCHKMELTQ